MSHFVILPGDCLHTLKSLPDNSVDSIVTDPPYGLSFMGKAWDYDVPTVAIWSECFRVLKPGGHLLAFAGTRTQHRMACRIEDAGFEIRDLIAWAYGSGFPKSLDISKAVDAQDAVAARRERALRFTAWMREQGVTSAQLDAATQTNMGGHYLTAAQQPAIATRPLFEVMRPLFPGPVPAWVELLVEERTVESENMKAREVLRTETMTCTKTARPAVARAAEGEVSVPRSVDITAPATEAAKEWDGWGTALKPALEPITVARKPLVGTVAANVLAHGTGGLNIDGCRVPDGDAEARWPANLMHDGTDIGIGEAARFFYCAKTSKADRGEGNTHPTVKPTDLMAYLCRLVTPPGGLVLDPFMGSGSTGKGALREGFAFIGCELSPEYVEIARERLNNSLHSAHIA